MPLLRSANHKWYPRKELTLRVTSKWERPLYSSAPRDPTLPRQSVVRLEQLLWTLAVCDSIVVGVDMIP
jgi:hypothetical protein